MFLTSLAIAAAPLPPEETAIVRQELEAIQTRIQAGEGPLAFIACHDETAENACAGKTDDLFAALPLERIRGIEGPNRISGQFYRMWIEPQSRPSAIWTIRYLPQEGANDVVLLRYYYPIPGPPAPPPTGQGQE